MIWLIGNKGMLGSEMELMLQKNNLDYIASDMDVDIIDYNVIKDFADNKSISWIINCSAYTAVDKAEDEAEAAYKINDTGVLNIVKIAKEKGAVLIHFSTDYIFDGTQKGAYTEEDITNPLGVYGKSKLRGEEHIIQMLSKFFIFRISWLYGEYGNNFVHTMLRLFGEREEVHVVDDQQGSPTYTIDVANMVIAVIQNNTNTYGVYNYTNDGLTNWYEFAREIFRVAKKIGLLNKEVKILPIKTADYPTKAKRPANSYFSKEKIKSQMKIDIRPWRDSLYKFLSSKVKGLIIGNFLIIMNLLLILINNKL